MVNAQTIRREISGHANPKRAALAGRYFKTGPGQYGEGDIFLGLNTPTLRMIAVKYESLEIKEIEKLLRSKIHEERVVALVMMVAKYRRGTAAVKNEIYRTYLNNTKWINNWDLVDISAPKIVGPQLLDGDKKVLYKLVRSKNLWERRIAVLATFDFIKHERFEDALQIAEMLLADSHDLIHKAVGWMLREVGKQNPAEERKFLDKHSSKMPRTMLRYAIEKFNEKERKHYLTAR